MKYSNDMDAERAFQEALLDAEALEQEALRREEILSDRLAQAAIDRALAPYVELASPTLLAAMRASLEEAILSPYATGLLDQLRAREAPSSTEERLIEGAPAGALRRSGTGA